MATERLGRFELVSHLASGGMGKVYLARIPGLAGFERHVVLKTLRASEIPDESYVSMFLDEARLAASLHHQHVAQVYEVGISDDVYFLAMEYVHGKSVRAVLEAADARRFWLPKDFSLSVICATAAGLHHAHDRCATDGSPLHIVHRDVSPSNILVSFDGTTKLIDFGIAKAVARTTQTATGFIKGKAGYMAPEQARGYEVDRRSDVFALGILAYELTTQHRAFDAPTEFERVEKIVHGDLVPPSHWVPDYPRALEEAVLTALALDPDERFQTADEMRIAFETVARHENLVLGSAPIAKLLLELFGTEKEPWLQTAAQPRRVARGSQRMSPPPIPGRAKGTIPPARLASVPEEIDEGDDVTVPVDTDVPEAPFLAKPLTPEDIDEVPIITVPLKKVSLSEIAEPNAASTIELRPRAGTIRPQMVTPRPPTHLPPSRRSALPFGARRWHIAAIITGGLGAGLLAGFIAVMTMSHTPAKPVAASAPEIAAEAPVVATPAVIAKPAAVVATPSKPAVIADEVTLSVTSMPSGATVVLDGERLGVTPFTKKIARADKQSFLKVRMVGFSAQRIPVKRGGDITWRVQLKKTAQVTDAE
ncbi:MAG TPA: serine/threonine-protein kinase [Kofleriaceae bacterium]|jgi:serine/threonine-protein kinase